MGSEMCIRDSWCRGIRLSRRRFFLRRDHLLIRVRKLVVWEGPYLALRLLVCCRISRRKLIHPRYPLTGRSVRSGRYMNLVFVLVFTEPWRNQMLIQLLTLRPLNSWHIRIATGCIEDAAIVRNVPVSHILVQPIQPMSQSVR